MLAPLSALIPLSWALVATVDAPELGELTAHRHGEFVAIADVGSREVKLYNRKGKYVRTVPGPNAPNLRSSTLWTGISNKVAMTPDGRIGLMKDSADYIPRIVWEQPYMLETVIYRVDLRHGDLTSSFPMHDMLNPSLNCPGIKAPLTCAFSTRWKL